MYSKTILERLVGYKQNHLKITGSGFWGGICYEHILPKLDEKLNILDSIRDDFWVYFNKLPKRIKLHQGFHHLNSSQAMCFNLFYPLFSKDYSLLSKAIEYIIKKSIKPTKITNFNVKNCEFEKIIDKKRKLILTSLLN